MKRLYLFIGFILTMTIFGLLPIWVVVSFKYHASDFTWSEVVKDGGLFFFTSTTLASCIYTYLAKGERDGIVSILSIIAIFGAVIMIACFSYNYGGMVAMNQQPNFKNHFTMIQIIGTIYSIAYATIVEAHIGGFNPQKQRKF